MTSTESITDTQDITITVTLLYLCSFVVYNLTLLEAVKQSVDRPQATTPCYTSYLSKLACQMMPYQV